MKGTCYLLCLLALVAGALSQQALQDWATTTCTDGALSSVEITMYTDSSYDPWCGIANAWDQWLSAFAASDETSVGNVWINDITTGVSVGGTYMERTAELYFCGAALENTITFDAGLNTAFLSNSDLTVCGTYEYCFKYNNGYSDVCAYGNTSRFSLETSVVAGPPEGQLTDIITTTYEIVLEFSTSAAYEEFRPGKLDTVKCGPPASTATNTTYCIKGDDDDDTSSSPSLSSPTTSTLVLAFLFTFATMTMFA